MASFQRINSFSPKSGESKPLRNATDDTRIINKKTQDKNSRHKLLNRTGTTKSDASLSGRSKSANISSSDFNRLESPKTSSSSSSEKMDKRKYHCLDQKLVEFRQKLPWQLIYALKKLKNVS